MTLRQDWEDSRHGEDLELLNARQRQRQQEIAARRLRPYLENAAVSKTVRHGERAAAAVEGRERDG